MFKKIVIFAVCFSVVFFTVESFFFVQSQIHIWDLVYNEETEEMDMLFIGSSMFFRNVDTPFINEATGLTTGILACGNENLTIALNDLERVLEHKDVKVVVIDSYVALAYTNSYPKDQYGVLMSHNDGMPDIRDRAKATIREFPVGNWGAAMFQICRPTLMWKRWEKKNPQEMIEDFGYWPLYEVKETIIEKDYTPDMMQEDCKNVIETEEMVDGRKSEKLFGELIDLAKRKGCEVWVLGMPRLDASYTKKEYKQVLRAFQIAQEHGSEKCIEFNLCQDKIGLEKTDFRDARHLNVNGSRKTTRYLLENYIAPALGAEINYPIYKIKNEKVEQEGEKYRYSLDTYGECYFKFTYFKDSKAEHTWESSEINSVLLDHELDSGERLYYEITDKRDGNIMNSGYFIKVVE